MTTVDRFDVLLADRAIWGHPTEAEREAQEWELAAGAVTTALLEERLEQPPADLQRRLRADALTFLARESGTDLGGASVLPWKRMLAAALILVSVSVAFSMWWTRPAVMPSAEARMAALLSQESSDVVRLDWQPGPSELRGEVRGEIVWSEAAQEGYMRLSGLPTNDPSSIQYQLWIFDAERSDAQPVDGGVFDIASGELVVPIDAKIKVHEAVMFAVTVEEPGGVVVSDREHIVALASI